MNYRRGIAPAHQTRLFQRRGLRSDPRLLLLVQLRHIRRKGRIDQRTDLAVCCEIRIDGLRKVVGARLLLVVASAESNENGRCKQDGFTHDSPPIFECLWPPCLDRSMPGIEHQRQSTASLGNPTPLAPRTGNAAAIDIAILMLREGLECVLVLAAITAGLTGEQQRYRRPIAGAKNPVHRSNPALLGEWLL